jgi:predicted  nucleic acid-binding Zn-ribbon protein
MCRRPKPRPSTRKTLAEIRKFLLDLNKKLECFMSETQDRLDALNARLQQAQETNSAATEGIRSDIADLKAQIEDLKTQVANGQTPDFTAIEATADSLMAGADALAGLDAETPASEQPPVEPAPEEPTA